MEERKRAIEETGTLPELETARSQLGLLRNKEAMLLDQYLEGVFDRDLVDLKMKQVQEGKCHYEVEVSRLERESSEAPAIIEMLDNFFASASHIARRLDTMADSEREETLRILIDRVTVSKGALTIVVALDLVGAETTATPT